MKTYTYHGHLVQLSCTTYRNNDTLAVSMIGADDSDIQTVVTVNLCSPMQNTAYAFVDENNNPGLGRWLESNGIASPLGVVQISGFCRYMLYDFYGL